MRTAFSIHTFAAFLVIFRHLVDLSTCFTPSNHRASHQYADLNSWKCDRKTARGSLSRIQVMPDLMAPFIPIIAGSVAGAIGVGVAYPADTMKTKSQTLAASDSGAENLGVAQLVKLVLKEEGIKGFYGGVGGVMMGQALIKAIAFASNSWALEFIAVQKGLPHSSIFDLGLAASMSGFITSFAVNPIERIKILMQADGNGTYSSEWNCATKVVERDGTSGLLFRGLDATMAREIPGYGFYFLAYQLLSQSELKLVLGQFAPLVFGALAGCLSWIPVYPFDVIKTSMQYTEGSAQGDSATSRTTILSTAMRLYRRGGWGIFFDGITPKLIRASINHSVTFYVYDLIINSLRS